MKFIVNLKKRKLNLIMLTLSSQTVSLANDFNDLSIRNNISYGSHKVSKTLMASRSFLDMLRDS